MNTKHLLRVVIVIIFSVLAVFSWGIYRAVQNYQQAIAKQALTYRIVDGVYERRLVAYDYLLNPVERAKDQWFAHQGALEQLVAKEEANFNSPNEKSHLEALKVALQGSRSTFEAVVVALEHDKAANNDLAVLESKRERFKSQLTIKGQEAVSAVEQLLTVNTANVERALDRIIISFSIAAAVLTIVLFACFRVIWRSTKQLENRRTQDEAILGSIGDGVLVLDAAGTIVLFNKTAELITGMSASEAIGRNYIDALAFTSEKDGSVVDEFIQLALAGKTSEMDRRTVLKRKDGTILPVAHSAAPVMDAQGMPQGIVIVFRDITQERQLERMKDEFLSIASHELRTPMGAIRANISMILAGDYGPVSKELIDPLADMKASTVRLVELVNDLLGVARIEAGRLKFTLSEFDIQPVLSSTAASLAPLGKEKGIDITYVPGTTLQVQADIDKVKQVVTNLIGNSLKFTSRGSITVEALLVRDMVQVNVSDTGIGISAEDQAKLFGKFKQISSAQDGKPLGTGLGLYISREIVRKMGGDLWIKHSVPGQGSIFTFTIPTIHSHQAQKAKHALEREASVHPDQK